MHTPRMIPIGLMLLTGLLLARTTGAQSPPTVMVPGSPGVAVPAIPPPGQDAYCMDEFRRVYPGHGGCNAGDIPIATPYPPGKPSYCTDNFGRVMARETGCYWGEIPMGAILPPQR